jgi:17beta-estradiol 17-dehydrogenase / very-long-chain 3-oxoacyl-CoA reductase
MDFDKFLTDFFWSAAFILGALKLISIILAILDCIYRHFVRKPYNLLVRYGKDFNTWALITGASDGIGAEYCRRLAHQGFNIVLVSRTLSKLKSVESEVQKINPRIKTKIV